MKTAEEWAEELWDGWGGVPTKYVFEQCLTEALAERDTEIARAREDERIAREILADHQEEYAPEWESRYKRALAEVRGQVLEALGALQGQAIAQREAAARTEEEYWSGELAGICTVSYYLKSLGPTAPPLRPTQAEQELTRLRVKMRELVDHCTLLAQPGADYPYAEVAYQDVANRLEELLGEKPARGKP